MQRLTLPLCIVVWVAIWFALKQVEPPIPGSVMTLYMSITTAAILVFAMATEERFRSFYTPILSLLTERRLLVPRVLFLIALPAALAWATYDRVRPKLDAPFEGRTIHPEPPSTFKFKGNDFDVLKTKNPLREPEAADSFAANVAEGKRIYYQNCVFCHGDYLSGAGHFAEAFNPLPANFRSSGTLSQLEEAYVFWRVATGGPGLPKGATPWNSAMPAWQSYLTEVEIWQVVLFIYEGSGSTPRTWAEGH